MMWRLLKGGSYLRPGTYINIDLIKEKLILVLTHEFACRTDRLSIGLLSLLTGIFSDVFDRLSSGLLSLLTGIFSDVFERLSIGLLSLLTGIFSDVFKYFQMYSQLRLDLVASNLLQ